MFFKLQTKPLFLSLQLFSFLQFSMDYLRKRWFSRSNPYILEALKNLPGTPREFRLKDLEKATNNFDEKMKLGEGAFGGVYRGYLANEDLEVAVKKGSLQGRKEFLTELTMIYQLRHRHLVRLLGWCHKHGKLLLVYDYMPNHSLDGHLFSDGDNKPLSWNLRYKIISEVASALHYLHNEFDQRVVHRDVKPSNILLDSKFNVKLGDLGISQALHKEKGSYKAAEGAIAGTMGYLDPEYVVTGKATELCDVFAFGVVLLEVGCGCRNIRPGSQVGEYFSLLEWVWDMYREGQLLEVVDKRLGKDYVVEEAQRILLLGLACSHPIASKRPKTQEIVQILSGSMAVPQVRPFKPPFIWPYRPAEEEDIVSLSDGVEYNSLTTTSDGSGWTPLATNEETQCPYAYTDFSLI